MTELGQRMEGVAALDSFGPTLAAKVEKGQEPNSLAGFERRKNTRYVLDQPLVVVPVLPSGYPDSDHQQLARTRDLSIGGIGLELAVQDWNPGLAFMVGLQMPDGRLHYAGVEMCHVDSHAEGRVLVGSQFGGRAQEILQPRNLTPTFDMNTMLFVQRYPEGMLKKWSELGILHEGLLDRVQLCPKCRGLPSFRPGCSACGAADVSNDRLIHHFACAHVGFIGDFETPSGLVCPKCRTRSLVVGADFEYQVGLYVCRICKWRGAELEHVARCLRCSFSFPGHQAHVQDLQGYQAHLFDPPGYLAHA